MSINFEPSYMNEFERLHEQFNWNIRRYASLQNGVWRSQSTRLRKVFYPDTGYEAFAEVENDSFWFQHRNSVLSCILLGHSKPAAFWEIGAGNGFVAAEFARRGVEVVTVDPSCSGAQAALRRGIKLSVCGFLEELHLPDESVPAMGSFDVLEHLQEPEELLREFDRVLLPEGIVLVSVPGLPWLWSQADDYAQHFCRYTVSSLDRLFEGIGFLRIRSGYFMTSLVPAVYWSRVRPYKKGLRLSDEELVAAVKRQINPPKNSLKLQLIKFALVMEKHWVRRLPLPIGTSVFGLYTKPVQRAINLHKL